MQKTFQQLEMLLIILRILTKIHLEMKISIPKWECKLNFTLPYYENNLNLYI